MKKFLCITMILALLFTLAACGAKDDAADKEPASSKPSSAAQTETIAPVATADEIAPAADAMMPGTLYQLNLGEDEEPIITGVSLDGNRVGSSGEGGVNGKAPTADSIRFVFEMNEWISIALDATQTTGLSAYILPHKDDPATYGDSITALLVDETPFVELNAPEDAETTFWGETYVHPDYWETGYYDLVFTSGVKPIARVMLKIYPDGGLSEKTDAELQQIMTEEIVAAQAQQPTVTE